MATQFNGQVAVITGGAQGIGYEVARRMLDRGARVALWDRDADALAQAKEGLQPHGDVLCVQVDITVPDAVAQAVLATESGMGSIAVLVHSAGIAGGNSPLSAYPHADWHRIIDVNLHGAFYVNQAVVRGMIQRNYGRIVNVASIAGKEGNPNAAAYSAAKAGLIAMTKSLGKETAQNNIAVNCITPAAAKTRLLEQMPQQQIDYMLAKIPRGRFVEVDEIAAMITWMASEENSFTTGAVFDISGGRATY
jgi:NAD(P)-dependent dehydrogenase (short-subunit alcohol dehydrogenase family)